MTHNNPLFNILQDIINNNFLGKTTRTTTLFKNFKCNSPRSKYKINVKTLAPMVPKGMAYPGFFKSPDMLAPAKNYKTFFFSIIEKWQKTQSLKYSGAVDSTCHAIAVNLISGESLGYQTSLISAIFADINIMSLGTPGIFCQLL